MVDLEIDGKKVTAPEGAMIIEVADAEGIYIPRFCYHKKLSIAANCRMCLVEISTARKAMPACATPVTPDMKVFTTSEMALEAQRVVMHFLLANHPLDCPICDQGGECELQDLAVGFGSSYSYFDEPKRSVAGDDIGPLIQTDMTRCIHCTRCVRFGEEVAGLRELGVTGRGGESEIGTYIQHFLKSELSGNIIDLCPVGALTAKPSLFTERAWELTERSSIAPHDCLGSHVYINTRDQEYAPEREVKRVNPKECESINEVWLSDRDRFSYQGVAHKERLLKPRMKKNGEWVDVEWKYALMAIADRLHAIAQNQSPDQIAALVSPNSTTEDCYLLQKLLRSLGSNNIDHRLRDLDFSDQDAMAIAPSLGISIKSVQKLNAILLVGSGMRFEQPLLAHRINKAVQAGAHAMVINPIDYQFAFDVSNQLIHADLVGQLSEVAKALADLTDTAQPALDAITPSEEAKKIAANFHKGKRAAIFLGDTAMQHPQAALLRQLADLIAEMSDATLGMVTQGANATGACFAGALPHRGPVGSKLEKPGLDAKRLLTTDPVRAYFLLGVEPEMDTAYPAAALAALKDAGCVVCLTPFATETMESYANFILPTAPFSETAGTYVNIEKKWQYFSEAGVPHGDAKPAWKIIRVLANFLQLDEFNYHALHEVQAELKAQVDQAPKMNFTPATLTTLPTYLPHAIRLATPHMYRVDSLVRRATSLQQCLNDEDNAVRINSGMAKSLGLIDTAQVTAEQGDQTLEIALVIDDRLADNIVLLPAALSQTAGFGEALADITLRRGS